MLELQLEKTHIPMQADNNSEPWSQPQQSAWAVDLPVPSYVSSPLLPGPYFSVNDLALPISGGMEPVLQHKPAPFPLSISLCFRPRGS